MLLTSAELDGIKQGRITVAFRSWTRPTVKAGGRLRTAIGELEIATVGSCNFESLTVRDAKAAGYNSVSALVAALRPDAAPCIALCSARCVQTRALRCVMTMR